LATLTELELAERDQRRIQRHLIEARLPPGKTLDSFDLAAVSMLSRAHVVALATGDGWIDRGGTILLFGPSGSGKSHLSAAFGHALIENGYWPELEISCHSSHMSDPRALGVIGGRG
jgi:DNA replication protein DnaC